MYYRKFVRDAYLEAVKLHPTVKQELKNALKSNDRVPKFVDDVAIEVQNVQDAFFLKNLEPMDDKAIKGLVYDLTNMFLQGCEQRATDMHMSDAQKMLIKQKQDYQRDLETMGGDFADIIKEGGVRFTEERAPEKK